jgi:peptidoglycan/xylan/chitin deacetylase (PgdA/CDA1 family)
MVVQPGRNAISRLGGSRHRQKMKTLLKLLFVLGGIILLSGVLLFLLYNMIHPKTQSGENVPVESRFSTEIEEAKKKAEEARLAEDEKKRQEEELKKFIATYGPCRTIPILMYHHIDDKSGSLYVSKSTFAGQMDYLSKKGYNTVTLTEVVSSLNGLSSLPAKPLVITFDDGYQDNYLNAYPVLRQYNMKATFFIISQLVGGGEYLTWDQLREMTGNHTLSHKAVAAETDSQLRDEILSAQSILKEQLGTTINTFAYPYGSLNSNAEKYLKEGGFAAAVTTQRGLSCAKLPYDLPRIRIGNAGMANFGL